MTSRRDLHRRLDNMDAGVPKPDQLLKGMDGAHLLFGDESPPEGFARIRRGDGTMSAVYHSPESLPDAYVCVDETSDYPVYMHPDDAHQQEGSQ